MHEPITVEDLIRMLQRENPKSTVFVPIADLSDVNNEEVTTTKLNVTCNNKGNFQLTCKSKSQGSLLYHLLQSFINKVKKLITK